LYEFGKLCGPKWSVLASAEGDDVAVGCTFKAIFNAS
jgi:hypothetical protein